MTTAVSVGYIETFYLTYTNMEPTCNYNGGDDNITTYISKLNTEVNEFLNNSTKRIDELNFINFVIKYGSINDILSINSFNYM